METVEREFVVTIDQMKIDGIVLIDIIPGSGFGPDTEDTKIVGHQFREIWFGENTAWHLEEEVLKALDLRKLLHGA